MRYILALVLILTPFVVFADAPDHRISDGDGHVLDISPVDGSIYASWTNDGEGKIPGALDIRVSDGELDVLDINANGSITVTE